jgi:hypothetical protein
MVFYSIRTVRNKEYTSNVSNVDRNDISLSGYLFWRVIPNHLMYTIGPFIPSSHFQHLFELF